MIARFAAVALIVGAVANFAPSPAAINPLHQSKDFAEDDLSGSGRELNKQQVKLANRGLPQSPNRRAMRLRIRVDAERAALVRVLHQLPATMGEYFPELPRDRPSAELLFALVRGVFEWRPLTVEELAAETGFAPDMVEETLRRFAAADLIDIREASSDSARSIFPKPALRSRGVALVDRLWTMVDSIDTA